MGALLHSRGPFFGILLSMYKGVMYGIPVEVEAFDIESNLVGSKPSADIVTGDPVIVGLNPNIAFKSLNL